MAAFFLSYRRHDSAGFAGRLADCLEAVFGAGAVFRDVEDIEPGQDYLGVIDAELQRAQVVLVMIGPAWLAPESDGKRRIDRPDDVVRHEVASAMATGKLIVPLLVSGAAMPGETLLPADIALLSRREAMVLSDEGWHADVAVLIETLRKWSPPIAVKPSAVRQWIVWAAVGLLLAAGATAAWLASREAEQARAARHSLAQLSGPWTAHVKYDWGDEYDETFQFKLLARSLHGTATYLGGRLAIEQANADGEWLSFSTRSQEGLNDSPYKEVEHRYLGQIKPDGIHFTLETSGGYSVHAPIEFVARRASGTATSHMN